MMLYDRRLKMCEIAKTEGTSKHGVRCISHQGITMRKFGASMMLHLFDADQEQPGIRISQQCLDLSKRNSINVMCHFVVSFLA